MLDAYVLHAIAYKNTSLIVKCFTKEYGIINVVANGAKRINSQFFGILQPFIPLLLYCKDYYRELATLYKAENNGASYRLQGAYLFGALYINELLVKLLANHDPDLRLFNDYHQFLSNLNQASKLFNLEHKIDRFLLETNLRSIEKSLLKTMGYELALIENLIPDDKFYIFDFEYGLRSYNSLEYNYQVDYINNNHLSNNINSCNNTDVLNKHNILNCNDNKVLNKHNIISGYSLKALYNNNFTNLQQLKEAKLFMRKIFAHFLNGRILEVAKLYL